QVPIISALRPSLEELVSQVTKAGAMPHEQLFNIAWFDFRRKANYQDGMTKVPLRSFFRRLSRECGFLVSPHRFRHTIATKLMRTPERNLQTVKTLLGHVSLASTLEYVEVNIESLKATLEQELRW
ncbi:TPA: site-specific integrase, partial [Klebsiella pneumoniae]